MLAKHTYAYGKCLCHETVHVMLVYCQCEFDMPGIFAYA